MIAEAAYFRAERRGFNGGDPALDWYEAESEVDARLREIEGERSVHGLDELLATATKKLAALKRKMKGLSAEARAEWQQDASKLAEVRDRLRSKLDELGGRGEGAAHKARQQVDKASAELSELLHKIGPKRH
jgi:hypothetical protein